MDSKEPVFLSNAELRRNSLSGLHEVTELKIPFRIYLSDVFFFIHHTPLLFLGIVVNVLPFEP